MHGLLHMSHDHAFNVIFSVLLMVVILVVGEIVMEFEKVVTYIISSPEI